MFVAADQLRRIAVFLTPVMPAACGEILARLGVSAASRFEEAGGAWDTALAGKRVVKGISLFPRIEVAKAGGGVRRPARRISRGGAAWLSLVLLLTPVPAGAGPKIVQDILDNGLKVVAVQDDKSPVSTIQVWYKVGSRHEPQGKTGLSHLLEHMMFKGRPRWARGSIQRPWRATGDGERLHEPGRDRLLPEVRPDRLELALSLEADRMTNLLLDPAEFELERKVVMEERRMRIEDDPTSLVVEEMFASAYKVHPYRHPVIGWMEDLAALSREDLVRHYKRYYVPNNAIVVVAGPTDPAEAIAKVKAAFGKIPKGDVPVETAVQEPPPLGERRVKVKKEAQLPFVFAGYPVPRVGHQDEYALDLLAQVLAAGKSSRLYKSLVYEKQIAAYAAASYDQMTSQDPALFYLYAGVKPGVRTEDVEKALYREVELIASQPVPEKEMEKAKNQVEAAFILGQDSIFNQARQIGQAELVGVGVRYIENYVAISGR